MTQGTIDQGSIGGSSSLSFMLQHEVPAGLAHVGLRFLDGASRHHTCLEPATHVDAFEVGIWQRGRVFGSIGDEDLHGQRLYGVSLCVGEAGQRLELHEGLAADAEEPAAQRGETQQTVDVLWVQDVIVLAQLDGGLHGRVHRA